ncbi:MAG: GNAT family acetyltransferase [Vulcanimicrobiaceae bacterium]
MKPSGVDVRRVVGAEIAPYLRDIARLRIDLFAHYPYLYAGDEAYEATYLQTYVRTPGSVALLARADGNVVGASTGAPLEAEPAETQAPFRTRGEDVGRTFYCGESLLRPAYRGRGIYRQFLFGREAFAREAGFATCAFCAVDRPAGHPARPPGYEPLDAIWTRFGYVRRPDLVASYAWTDIGDTAETEKPMIFWLKSLECATP